VSNGLSSLPLLPGSQRFHRSIYLQPEFKSSKSLRCQNIPAARKHYTCTELHKLQGGEESRDTTNCQLQFSTAGRTTPVLTFAHQIEGSRRWRGLLPRRQLDISAVARNGTARAPGERRATTRAPGDGAGSCRAKDGDAVGRKGRARWGAGAWPPAWGTRTGSAGARAGRLRWDAATYEPAMREGIWG
jgi:hypothetical protein